MKHTITFFAVLLLAMAIPANAQNYLFSDTLADGQVLYFDTLNGEARVVRPGTGIALNNYITGNVVVPSTVTYYGMTYVVTTLACVGNYGTFEGCSSLLSVSLPNTITAIDKYAFYNCTGMTNISVPDSVVSIGHNAFSHCTSLVSINIPDAVTSIGDYAFSGCTSITDTLTIPSTVASIGQNAFSNVPMIQYFGKSIDYFPWNAVNAVTFTIDSLIYSDPNHSMLVGYVNGITIADIPDTVLKMKRECFYQCSTLVSVICPNSVTTIPRGAFSSCPNLIFVDIPSSVTKIEESAFAYCPNLTSITIPCSVDTIGNGIIGCGNDHNESIEMWLMKSIPPIVLQSNGYSGILANMFSCFSSWFGNYTIHIPIGSLTSYQIANSYIPNNISLIEDINMTTPYTTTLNVNYGNMGNASYTARGCMLEHVIIEATPNDGYYFRAWSNGSTNNPDTLTLTSDTTITAIFVPDVTPQICMVSVQDSHNVVMWNKENDGVIATYNIYREGNVTGEYELIWSLPFDSISVWIDTASRPSSRSYRYRMTATDTYGYESAPSEVHKTMHLTINRGMGNNWNLAWTEYEGADFVTYMIYRGNHWGTMQMIDQMPVGGNTSYTDENAPSGNIYYQVVVVKAAPCTPTKSEALIRSNIASYEEDTPEGIDDIDEDGIGIYARNGQIIVTGAAGETVQVFDIMGRHTTNEMLPNGVYLVKIGNHPARKVVVIR